MGTRQDYGNVGQERAAAALLHEKASGHTGTVLNVRRELDVDGRAGRGKAVLLSMIIKACGGEGRAGES
jgi:hypothetical protein